MATDRWRYGTPPSNNLLYLCPLSNQIGIPSSIEITAISKENARRFIISSGEIYNFMLSSKEYAYFVYSNPYL